MTPQMIMTMIVLGFAVFLFISEWVRVDVVGIMMMILLPIVGLISPKEAFVGLSSNAVCSIIAVIILGAGLDKTGVMNKVAGPIVKLAGKSEKKVITFIAGTVGLISSVEQQLCFFRLPCESPKERGCLHHEFSCPWDFVPLSEEPSL